MKNYLIMGTLLLLIIGGCISGCGALSPAVTPVPVNPVATANVDLTPEIRQTTWDAYAKVLEEVRAIKFPVDPVMAHERLKGKENSFLCKEQLDIRRVLWRLVRFVCKKSLGELHHQG